MALDYSDKRGRYRNVHPASLPPATPKFDNPVKQAADVVYARPAIRGHREAFRVSTAPVEPAPPPMPESLPAERIPDWQFEDTRGTPHAEGDKEL